MDVAMELAPARSTQADAPDTDRIGPAIARLVYVLLRPMRYRRRYRQTLSELNGLENRMLQDVGIGRWQIADHARIVAARDLPERGSAGAAARAAMRAIARAWRRTQQARRSREQLTRLDDHMLRDIGMPRGQVLLYGMSRAWGDAYVDLAAAGERRPAVGGTAESEPAPPARRPHTPSARPSRATSPDRAAQAC